MKRRLLSTILIAMMCLTMSPLPVMAEEDTITDAEDNGILLLADPEMGGAIASANSWINIQALINNATDSETYTITLTDNITNNGSDSTLTVPAGQDIVIDLNGHYIDAKEVTTVFDVSGKLTIKNSDSQNYMNAAIMNGKTDASDSAGGIVVEDGGKVIMSGGHIRDCEATSVRNTAGGIYIKQDGSFTLTSDGQAGYITGCKGQAATLGQNAASGILNAGIFTINGGNVGECLVNGNVSSTFCNIGTVNANYGTIYGGFYNGYNGVITTTNKVGGSYTSFKTKVENEYGTIKAGKFESGYTVINRNGATIEGGTFNGEVKNGSDAAIGNYYKGTINDGTFYGEVKNGIGTINGGTYYGTVDKTGTIADSAYKTVTFDANGGSAVDSQKILKGQKVIEPTNPTRNKYSFVRWNNGNNPYSFDSPALDNLTLKAEWKATETYKVYIYVNYTTMKIANNSGSVSQEVVEDIKDVVCNAQSDYYFPEDYKVEPKNGITVTRNSYSQITISGTPTADTEITLPAATAKTKFDKPSNVTFVVTGYSTGKLLGTAPDMCYKLGYSKEVTCSNNETIVSDVIYDVTNKLTNNKIHIYRKGDEKHSESNWQTINFTRAAKPSLTETQPDANKPTGSIPTTSEHEYSTDGTNFIPCTGTMDNLPLGTYYVRVKAHDTVLASDAQEIVIRGYFTATATINGDAKYGETLSVSLENANSSNISYKWYRDETEISGAASDSYTLTEDDIGKAIKVIISASGMNGTVTATTNIVEKADCTETAAAATVTKTADSITVTNVTAGQEYAIAAGNAEPTDWNTTGKFTDLKANALYKVYTRVAETETVKASAAVSTEVNTDRIEGIITLIKAAHIIYDGEAVEIGEGKDLNYTYNGDGEVTISWYENDRGDVGEELADAPANAGTYWFKVAAPQTDKYTDVYELLEFTVEQKDISSVAIIYGEQNIYDGNIHEAAVSVSDGDVLLQENTDYTLSDNTAAEVTKKYVKISGIGNYKGTAAASEAWSLQQREVTLEWQNIAERKYNDGKIVTAIVANKVGTDDVNVTVTGGAETSVDTHTAVAAALSGAKSGNYKLPPNPTIEYTIAKADIVNTAPTAKRGLVYNTEAQDLINAGTVVETEGFIWQYKIGESGTYSAALPKAINAGTYQVYAKIDGNDNYNSVAETLIGNVEIAKANPEYIVPTDLKGYQGRALSTVNLPGGWSWKDGSERMSKTGNQTFKATFTPNDTDNYNIIENIDVTVNVRSTALPGGAAQTEFGITAPKADNGSIGISQKEASAGTTIIVSLTPAEGYKAGSLTVTDKNGNKLTLKSVGENKYTFTMPNSAVDIKANFVKADGSSTVDPKTAIIMQIGNKSVNAYGKTIASDVAPLIINSRTMVPIRIVTETLGGSADWNGKAQVVTLNINGKTITMKIGVVLEKYGVAPLIIDNRTYVPIRFVAEELGATVDWNADTQEIVIRK